jgi:SAM-dependent methyltransferase
LLTFRHRLGAVDGVRYRLPWLLAQCAGKRVLDVGCAGAGCFAQRSQCGTALHPCLVRVARNVLGVDVDAAALDMLRRAGCDQVIEADLTDAATAVIAEIEKRMNACDVVLCGEVLEHVCNPGDLLAGVRQVARHFNAEVIVTVPNAFCFRAVLWVMAGVESVHPDHKCYYSWQTIQSLMQRSGFEIVRVLFYADEVRGKARRVAMGLAKQLLHTAVVRLAPQFGQGLIVIARSN